MTTIRKYWIVGVMVAVFVGALATILNLATRIGQPFGGFYTSRNYSTNLWQVDAPTPPWWPALNISGLRYDDELVALEDTPYGPDAYHYYAEALQTRKDSVALTIRRAGTLLELNIPVRTFTVSNLLDMKLPDLLVGLGFWLLAISVYLARPQESVNRIFSIACSLTAGSIWMTIRALFPQSDLLTRSLELGWVFCASFFSVGFIHLASLFPEPVHHNAMRWIKALYIFMVFTAATYTLSLILRWNAVVSPLGDWLSSFSNALAMGMFGIAVLIYLGRLLRLLWRPALSRRVRRQVILLLLGLTLALPYALVVVVRAVLNGTMSYFWNDLDLRYLVLAVPLTFAFVILRYQTFQRTPPPIIGVFILASSAFIGSMGAWVVRIMEPEWVNSLTWTPFVPLFGIALISSIFWSSQSSWWGAFSRLFQWERRSYAAVRLFGAQVINEVDLTRLPSTIATALVANMELERTAIWLWNEKDMLYNLAGQAGKWPQLPPAQLFPGAAPTSSQSLRIQGGDEMLPNWLKPLEAKGMIEVATPLAISGRPIGLLGLGKRWDEEIIDERDLQIVELIAQQSGLFLLTALHIEELQQVPQQITTAQERERFKIAQELHDTVQQFLGRLPFFLDVSRSSARTNPAETESILSRCIADVESAAQTVREIRNNLAPLQLETSLSQPLRLLIEQFSGRNSLAVQVSISPKVDAHLSAEARHALYRVVQQALDNIAEHAKASHVSIRIGPKQEQMHFMITDDGVGFSAVQRAAAEASGSFGLKSMQARISSQGGEFTIRAGAKSGTEVSGWLPMLVTDKTSPATEA